MLRRMLAAAAAATSVLALAAAPASAGVAGWRGIPLPSNLGFSVLGGISALGPSDAWAVGSEISNNPILLHWNGKAWSVRPTPGIPAGTTLQNVDARSNRDILANGDDTTTGLNVVYRFNGSRWTSLPRPSNEDGGFAPFSASFGPGGQIWAFGWVATIPTFFKLTTSGWRTYRTGVTERGALSSPRWVRPDDAWAFGFTFTTIAPITDTPVLVHFNGRTWSRVPAPPFPSTAVSATLNGMVVRGRRLWLSGNWRPCASDGACASVPFAATGNGTHWTSEPIPAGVTAVSGLSPGRTGRPQWMTATTSNLESSYYLRYARGSWVLVQGVTIAGQENPKMTVVHIPGTDASWAVGSARSGPTILSLAPRIELNGDLP